MLALHPIAGAPIAGLLSAFLISCGIASETESGLAARPVKVRTVGIASETDAALAVTARKTVTAGIPAETDSAPAAIGVHALLAAEADSGLAATPRKTRTAGLASETDSGLAATARKTATTGLPLETDSGLAATARKTSMAGIASEVDTGLVATPARLVVAGISVEADSALASRALKTAHAGIATETDSALSSHADRVITVGIATETDSALHLLPFRINVGVATETDQAFQLVRPRAAIRLEAQRSTTLGAQWSVFVYEAQRNTYAAERDSGPLVLEARREAVEVAMGVQVGPIRDVFSGEARSLRYVVKDETGTVIDITGWALSWSLDTYPALVNVLTKTVGSGITIPVGTDGVANVSLSAANLTIADGNYRQTLRRTDAGFESVLSYGLFVVGATLG